MIEYTITIKDENFKLENKDISYEPISLDIDNPWLADKVKALFKRFQDELAGEQTEPDIIVKAKMLWKM